MMSTTAFSKALKECEEFIEIYSPEELVEYEKSLNLDYDKYKAMEIKVMPWIKQEPCVEDDGIYIPCDEYAPENCATTYKMLISKDIFVEAYNKWIKGEQND